MTYIDDNKARNCSEFLEIIHKAISSGFLKFNQTLETLDCGVHSNCKPCIFAAGNSYYGCPCGGIPNLLLDEYIKSYYPEYFV